MLKVKTRVSDAVRVILVSPAFEVKMWASNPTGSSHLSDCLALANLFPDLFVKLTKVSIKLGFAIRVSNNRMKTRPTRDDIFPLVNYCSRVCCVNNSSSIISNVNQWVTGREELPSSRMGATRSCMIGPSGRYILTGTLLTLYAPSLSGPPVLGSTDGGRVWREVLDGGGGDVGREGDVVGVTFDATRQYSSKLSENLL